MNVTCFSTIVLASFGLASASMSAETDELQVYRAVFKAAGSLGGLIKPRGAVVFRPHEAREMELDVDRAYFRKEFKGVEDSTMEDYAKAQQRPPILGTDSDFGFKIVVLTKEL